ncbi:hypothetical protein P7K49_033673 [Saguinus oedipus]|uniref:Transducer of regulated CREB activity C-terminal domain-containing protein n=1 Tax=Saguinus oedipus TaxID=9490 RepID=A0ABQ9TSN2_SAGOE|nr:hypothetical protein P7K49_033673 [Saguinus oedipus]
MSHGGDTSWSSQPLGCYQASGSRKVTLSHQVHLPALATVTFSGPCWVGVPIPVDPNFPIIEMELRRDGGGALGRDVQGAEASQEHPEWGAPPEPQNKHNHQPPAIPGAIWEAWEVPTSRLALGRDHSRPLFCLQHTSTLGSVFGDAYYEQQMAARQANALSHQVSGRPGCQSAGAQDRRSLGPGPCESGLHVLLGGPCLPLGFTSRPPPCPICGLQKLRAQQGWPSAASWYLRPPTEWRPRTEGEGQAANAGPGRDGTVAVDTAPRHGPCTWVCREVLLALRGGQDPFGVARRPQVMGGAGLVLGSLGAGHPAGAASPAAGRPAKQAHSGPHGPLEQFNMMENAISSSSLYSPGSTLNYSQAAMMGLTGSHGSLPDSQQLGYAGHSGIPNIILTVTGESPPSLSKELTSSLAGVGDVSFDSDSQFPLDELKIDPLTLDGLHMLNDPDMVLADPATEDTFRMDRL